MKYTLAILALVGVSAVKLEHHHKHHTQQQAMSCQIDPNQERCEGNSFAATAVDVNEYNAHSLAQANGDGETDEAAAGCDALEISAKKMKYEMENFSRNFDVKHYNNAMLIASKLGKRPPMVNTWELYDKAFSFPRVRQYNIVRQGMNDLEMF